MKIKVLGIIMSDVSAMIILPMGYFSLEDMLEYAMNEQLRFLRRKAYVIFEGMRCILF